MPKFHRYCAAPRRCDPQERRGSRHQPTAWTRRPRRLRSSKRPGFFTQTPPTPTVAALTDLLLPQVGERRFWAKEGAGESLAIFLGHLRGDLAVPGSPLTCFGIS